MTNEQIEIAGEPCEVDVDESHPVRDLHAEVLA
jgi:hypothetical protein